MPLTPEKQVLSKLIEDGIGVVIASSRDALVDVAIKLHKPGVPALQDCLDCGREMRSFFRNSEWPFSSLGAVIRFENILTYVCEGQGCANSGLDEGPEDNKQGKIMGSSLDFIHANLTALNYGTGQPPTIDLIRATLLR